MSTDAGRPVGRFAPSTTGRAHPGTLLAALLCWLDLRRRGGRLVLRLEDLDPQRCLPAFADGLRDDLGWFGLDWDECEAQSAHTDRYEAAARRLARSGRVYRCRCSRREIAAAGRPAVDGGVVYPGTCRARVWNPDDELPGPEAILRFALPPGPVACVDVDGTDRSLDVVEALGDPVIRRRDGAWAYQLAGVVDDAAAGVTDIVRGRDLAPSTPLQVALATALGQRPPRYRHHLLLLEPQGTKFAKFHRAVGADELRRHYTPSGLCGLLAQVAGLQPTAAPCAPADLVADFAWIRVRQSDQVLDWTGTELQWRT